MSQRKVRKFMLLSFKKLHELNFQQLMVVYEEGNIENGQIRYPDHAPAEQQRLAENDFEDYLRQDFFSLKDSSYYVWEENGRYISALRIEPYLDGVLLCALETKPNMRRKGYAKRLIDAVLSDYDVPVYSHISKRNKASIAAHISCGFSKLHDGAKYLDGSVSSFADTYIYKI